METKYALGVRQEVEGQARDLWFVFDANLNDGVFKRFANLIEYYRGDDYSLGAVTQVMLEEFYADLHVSHLPEVDHTLHLYDPESQLMHLIDQDKYFESQPLNALVSFPLLQWIGRY